MCLLRAEYAMFLANCNTSLLSQKKNVQTNQENTGEIEFTERLVEDITETETTEGVQEDNCNNCSLSLSLNNESRTYDNDGRIARRIVHLIYAFRTPMGKADQSIDKNQKALVYMTNDKYQLFYWSMSDQRIQMDNNFLESI